MKFKAAITDNAPVRLLKRLDDRETAELLMAKVVQGCLHVNHQDLGPATHYVQKSDSLIALTDDIGVVVGLTLVSKMRSRSDQDFADALDAIEHIYEKIVREEVQRGRRAQLFVAIALDGDVEAPRHMGGRQTNLLETVPKWIEGRATGSHGFEPILDGLAGTT